MLPWSRVRLICDTETDRQMLEKANVLQYKKNSAQLTKSQKYALIARGKWINRTKTYATQSDICSNPNTNSLRREGGEAVCFDRSSPYQYDLLNPFNCDEVLCYNELTDTSYNVVIDGGILLGNQTVNQCNPSIPVKTTTTESCNWTTASGVPGKIQKLCWDNRLTSWTPAPRYTMNNSAQTLNNKGLNIAGAPVLKYDAPGSLSWSYCYQVSGYSLYKDGVLYRNVVEKNITGLPVGQYYVVAFVTNAVSHPSNIVTLTV
jgi:hypothetical protein